jgi:hypothetical protein
VEGVIADGRDGQAAIFGRSDDLGWNAVVACNGVGFTIAI